MNDIVPRWEWRTFGTDFGAADAKFGALRIEQTQESDELYLLSRATHVTVKIRDALLDIKQLELVDEVGLEQWRPAMKSAFPLRPDEVNTVCAALAVAPPAHASDALTQDQFLAELAAPGCGVRPVAVHKRRSHYRVGGCLSEVTEVVADGVKGRTVAIESEDASRVIAAVREMGLSGFRNTNYPQGLKTLLGIDD